VIVSNAGYGLFDAVEELIDAQVDPEAPSPHFADGSPIANRARRLHRFPPGD
jgi:hypothetical protein